MKKTYRKPACTTVRLMGTSEILSGSILNGEGGENVDITPGSGEYDGNFQSHRRSIWDDADWSE